jgi:hypothetical protein
VARGFEDALAYLPKPSGILQGTHGSERQQACQPGGEVNDILVHYRTTDGNRGAQERYQHSRDTISR